jgi:hypothetical protein
MPISGTSSTALVQLDLTFDTDPDRFHRLARLLLTPSTMWSEPITRRASS